jgi:hypothetical protein
MVQLFSTISNDIHFSLITNFSKKLILGNMQVLRINLRFCHFKQEIQLKGIIDADILVNSE